MRFPPTKSKNIPLSRASPALEEMRIKETFSHNLKFLRTQTPHLSQQALAIRLGISQKTLSNYESGRHIPPVHILASISAYFRIPMQDLLYKKLYIKKERME